MASRQHYVSQFHLKGFTDPTCGGNQEPWLWVADCGQELVKRKAAKNFGWVRDVFDGPGGLVDRDRTLESFLSTEVEGPGSHALRGFVNTPPELRKVIPPELLRYLAWAAARSLPMLQLYESWIDGIAHPINQEVVEPPPPALEKWQEHESFHQMDILPKGRLESVPSSEVRALVEKGWRLRLSPSDFLEFVHVQAYYFQVRWFPRMQWFILDAPPGKFFIVGDRPVIWGFDGLYDEPPSCLRHPLAQIVAPLSRSVALFACDKSGGTPTAIMPEQINQFVALAAHEWIAGPSEATVREAMSNRAYQ